MKNLLKSIVVSLVLLFSFTSCDELLKDSQACNDTYNYHIEFHVTACVFRDGKIVAWGDLVEFTTTKYYCDEHSYPADGAVRTNEFDGCGKGNSVFGYQLHNNFDYVIVTAWLRHKDKGRYLQTSQRYDYKDFTEAEKAASNKVVDVHFTFNNF